MMPGPFAVFLASFCIPAVAGLAYLLHSGKDLTRREVCTSLLYSGCLGLSVSMLFFGDFNGTEEGLYRLIGIASLCGLAGVTASMFMDFVRPFMRNDDANGSRSPIPKRDSDVV